jgi:hypothetical protein
MLAILVLIRDALIATALAWVGVTVEARVNTDAGCAGDACHTDNAN